MIDHLLALDPGARGIGRFFVAGGAASAARALHRGGRTLITTLGVGVTLTSTRPTSRRPSSNSRNDSAPAMQPT